MTRSIEFQKVALLPSPKAALKALSGSVGPKPVHDPIYLPLDPAHPLSLTNSLISISEEQERAAPVKKPTGIYGSAWWKCARMQLYDLLGFQPEPAEYVWEWDLAARLGDAVHNEVQKDLIKRGLVAYLKNFTDNAARRRQYRKRGKRQAAIEVSLDHRTVPPAVAAELAALKLRIRLDAIIKRPAKPETIVEIKTVDSKYFNDYQKLAKYKLPSYDPQIQLQMHYYRDSETGRRPQFAICYVVNRNAITQRMEIPIYYDADFAEWGVRRIQAIKAAWDQQTLLPPEPGSDCRFCRHFKKCPAKGRDQLLENEASPQDFLADATRFIYR
jgi:CRISPR/Cas system-associated exonuclease Cas4 (RecB family)